MTGVYSLFVLDSDLCVRGQSIYQTQGFSQ